jgi:hypothetical protein
MLINSLEEMETIVESNKSLSWDGWTVLERTKSPTAWSDKTGVFINKVWYIQKRYDLMENGWEVPSKFVRKSAS